MKLLVFVIFSLVFCTYGSSKDHESSGVDPITTEVSTAEIMICDGQCSDISTDIDIEITGGTPPYLVRIAFEWSPTAPTTSSTFTLRSDTENHVLRICNSSTATDPGGEEFIGDTTQFTIPTNFLPSVIQFREVQDANGCISTDFGSIDRVSVTPIQGTFTIYDANIPQHICDELVLPPIIPNSATVAYYSEPLGNGTAFMPGAVLDFNTINLPTGDLLDTLYVFDPADICQSQALIPFTLNLSPNHNVPDDQSLCDNYTLPDFSGPVTSPSAMYASNRDFNPGSVIQPGDVISNTTMIYLQDIINYPTGDCIFLDSFLVEIVDMPFAGIDSIVTLCVGESNIITDPRILLSNPNAGGEWQSSGITVPDVDLNNPMDINLSNLNSGEQYILTYTIEVTSCLISSATLTFNAVDPPFAGDSTSISLCSGDGVQDFFSLIGQPELGGIWTQTTGAPTNFADFSQADFSGFSDDIYTFNYTIDASSSCPEQVAELVINLNSGPNAGADNMAIVCKGDMIDIRTLLSSDADMGGNFIVEGGIPLFNGIWDSNQFIGDEGIVNINYILNSSSPNCPSDTSIFVIDLIQQPFAGLAMAPSIDLCVGEEFLLSDFIDGETNGGEFHLSTDLNTSIPDLYTAGNSDVTIAHIVPGGGSCDPDTTMFGILIQQPVDVSLEFEDNQVCVSEGLCIALNLVISEEVQSSFFITNGQNDSIHIDRDRFGFNQYQVCLSGSYGQVANDSIFIGMGNALLSVEVDSLMTRSACIGNISSASQITFNTGTTEIFTGSVCEGETTDINGMQFGETTELTFANINGCDSIIQIVIDTFPSEVGFIQGRFCEGQSEEILGQTFSRDTLGMITFPNMSAFGCDSTAQVDLIFADRAVGQIDTMICDGSSVEIDGVVISQEGMMEIDFAQGSQAGCDSSTVVNVTVMDLVRGTIDTTICEGSSIVIDGVTLSELGSETVPFAPGSAMGCDSSTLVIIRFQQSMVEQIDGYLCFDETIDILGVTYDINTLPNEIFIQDSEGCDSVTLQINIQRILDQIILNPLPVCDETEEPVILYNGSFSFPPVQIFVNDVLDTIIGDQNNPIMGLPLELDAAFGTNEIRVEDQFCTITRTVEINPPVLDIFADSLGGNFFDLSLITSDSLILQDWTGSDLLTCDNCESTSITIEEDTEIFVSAETVDGCLITASILLEAEEALPEVTDIFIPTAISTGLNENDVFFLQSEDEFMITQLNIYDRWGNLVFANENFMTNDSVQGWDGRINNTNAEQGVYVYQLEYEDPILGTQVLAGSLTIIK